METAKWPVPYFSHTALCMLARISRNIPTTWAASSTIELRVPAAEVDTRRYNHAALARLRNGIGNRDRNGNVYGMITSCLITGCICGSNRMWRRWWSISKGRRVSIHVGDVDGHADDVHVGQMWTDGDMRLGFFAKSFWLNCWCGGRYMGLGFWCGCGTVLTTAGFTRLAAGPSLAACLRLAAGAAGWGAGRRVFAAS